jgi:ribokinase
MAGERDGESPDALVLAHALEKLRAREGLTLSRLRGSRREVAAPLLRLAAVRRYATVHDVDLEQATVDVVAQCIRDSLGGVQRPVADAILALGVFVDAYRNHGIDAPVVDALRSPSLGLRRSTLLARWRQLHEALGENPEEPPSDRVLRGITEQAALRELARQLIRREVYSLGSKSATNGRPEANPIDTSTEHSSGKVIVVGGAVMDATFRTKILPQRETSTEAHGFDLSPGGKGLTQAVAAARLGLDVSLVAAVTDDQFGRQIVSYLRAEGVDTSLLKLVEDARTPFTGVIEFELGDSIAVNWRNEVELRLDVRDVENISEHLRDCDALLITFELPRETMQRALAIAHSSSGDRPLIIVTPGHPYPDSGISGQSLAQIDYMVAHAWELGRYAPPDQLTFDLDAVARRLLAYGVETLCVPIGGGCTIYSETPVGTFTVPTFPSSYKESSAARDAFCAALAAKLIERDQQFTEEVALWATAAMAAATADYPVPNSMPDRRRVEQLLGRSRFTVTPRHAATNGAAVVDHDEGWPRSPR